MTRNKPKYKLRTTAEEGEYVPLLYLIAAMFICLIYLNGARPAWAKSTMLTVFVVYVTGCALMMITIKSMDV